MHDAIIKYIYISEHRKIVIYDCICKIFIMFGKAIIIALCLSAVFTQALKKHYGNPKNGCRSDEFPAQIQGMNGDVCMPHCTGNTCPTDLPDSQTTATPACIVEDQMGNFYCVLQCGGKKMCPIGATCQAAPHAESKNNRILQAMNGLCMYPKQAIMVHLRGNFMDN